MIDNDHHKNGGCPLTPPDGAANTPAAPIEETWMGETETNE